MLELETRRKKVFDQMKDNSIAIFFSGVSKIASEDENLPFCVNKISSTSLIFNKNTALFY